MKTILDDVEGFFEGGGWDFLSSQGDDSEGENGSGSESEQDETYQPSGLIYMQYLLIIYIYIYFPVIEQRLGVIKY